MTPRLFLTGGLAAGTIKPLLPEQAHYLLRVLRLSPGADIFCCDGAGALWRGTLVRIGTRSYGAELIHQDALTPPPAQRLHLLQGLLKGAAMDTVLQKATELGATDIWLLESARSNVSLGAERVERKREHWLGVLESAAAQCQQLHLPALHGPLTLPDALNSVANTTLLLLDPGAPTLPRELPDGPVAILVGPEGGFAASERALALSRGARACGLGELVLRAETAPLAALAAIRHSRGWC
ncbi:MAG: RsmE family RNA methyltransferase [Pseudomonadales bacterium]